MVLKFSSAVRVFERFIRRAGRTGSTAGGTPAATPDADSLSALRSQ
jgi:hypothetical protein